jgi:hypothetical protein
MSRSMYFLVMFELLMVSRQEPDGNGYNSVRSKRLCDKDVVVSIHVVNQFVRMESRPLDPIRVINVVEKVATSSGCDPKFFSLTQMNLAASMLGKGGLSDEVLLQMIEHADKELIESKVKEAPHNAWKIYSDAVSKRPYDSKTRLELGKSLALAERHADAMHHLEISSRDPATFQSATFALASLLIQDQPDEAAKRYSALISAEPLSEIYWLCFADALKGLHHRSSISQNMTKTRCGIWARLLCSPRPALVLDWSTESPYPTESITRR